ncbi:MAG TPA: condensation domain-containing protein [Pyrinomonadaceae bacterium]
MSTLLNAVADLSPGQRAILEQRLKQKRAGVAQARITCQSRAANSFVLSFAQQRLWFLHRLAPESNAYNIPNALHARGRLKLDALERSINEIRRRHEVLRTTFAVRDGQPVQIIRSAQAEVLPLVDLSGLPEGEQQPLAQQFIETESNRAFDLERETALRVSVLRLQPDEHVILFTMHHIACDSWSIDVLVREVATLYEAFSAGQSSPLPELPIQYADFAVWQRQWLQGKELENQQNYWRHQLAGMPLVLQLPFDRPRPARESSRGALHSIVLSKDLSTQLQTLSRKQGVTLFMTLLAGFKILLQYLTNQDDIVVGTDVANRGRVETENLIGFFVNQVVLRTRISAESTFAELLERVREVTLAGYANQDLPFEKVLELINPDRSLTHAPLFQVKLIMNHAGGGGGGGGLALRDLKLKSLNPERTTAQLDINLALWETPEGTGGWFNYNTDLFDSTTMARFATLFEKVLQAAALRPLATVSELRSMLAEEDGRQYAQSSRHRLNLAKRKSVVIGG